MRVPERDADAAGRNLVARAVDLGQFLSGCHLLLQRFLLTRKCRGEEGNLVPRSLKLFKHAVALGEQGRVGLVQRLWTFSTCICVCMYIDMLAPK